MTLGLLLSKYVQKQCVSAFCVFKAVVLRIYMVSGTEKEAESQVLGVTMVLEVRSRAQIKVFAAKSWVSFYN